MQQPVSGSVTPTLTSQATLAASPQDASSNGTLPPIAAGPFDTSPSDWVTEIVTVIYDETTTLGTPESETIADIRACNYDPCHGNGDCLLTNTAKGYECSCLPAYTGKIHSSVGGGGGLTAHMIGYAPVSKRVSLSDIHVRPRWCFLN